MARDVLVSACALMKRSHLRSRRGFTLIELGVVVIIVGILAVLAVVGYRKIVVSSKMNEARQMVGAIMIAQEEYKAERGLYVNIGATYCPSDGAQFKKYGWDNACGPAGGWSVLPVHADNAVQFGYTTFAGTTVAQPAGVDTQLLDLSAYNGKNVPYYVVHAKAELDAPADGVFTEVAGSSFDKEIRVLHVGE